MAETYCGKSCAECRQKEFLNCPGCKVGPGRRFDGDCELAKCCREKGHETCDTCGFNGGCATLRRHDQQPEYRKMEIESAQKHKELLANRAPFLGKWLSILFWLVVPGIIAGIMKNENVMKVSFGIYLTGQIMNAVCSLAYGAILLKLSAMEDRYHTAGIYALIRSGIGILLTIISGAATASTWSLIIALPATVLGMIGEYYEYNAHSSVLLGADDKLSEKWSTLWKWYLRCTLGLIGSVLLTLITPILGVILFVVALIGTIIVSIAKLVYLYRTAKAFREYSVEGFFSK